MDVPRKHYSAKEIGRMKALRKEGLKYHQISQKLLEEGITDSWGKAVNPSTMAGIFRGARVRKKKASKEAAIRQVDAANGESTAEKKIEAVKTMLAMGHMDADSRISLVLLMLGD